MNANAVFGQRRHQFVVPERVLRGDQLVHESLDGVECFRRAHAIRADIARLAFDLLLDAGDANLEKLVEIRAEDGEEFDPLDQRLRRVLRFFQNAPVELEPAQLAIDEIRRIGKIAFRLDRIWQECQLVRRYFGSRSLHLMSALSPSDLPNQRCTFAASGASYARAATCWCRMSSAAAA